MTSGSTLSWIIKYGHSSTFCRGVERGRDVDRRKFDRISTSGCPGSRADTEENTISRSRQWVRGDEWRHGLHGGLPDGRGVADFGGRRGRRGRSRGAVPLDAADDQGGQSSFFT